jgi:hypothetical protein
VAGGITPLYSPLLVSVLEVLTFIDLPDVVGRDKDADQRWNKFLQTIPAATTKNVTPHEDALQQFSVSLRRWTYHTRLLNTVMNSLDR